MAGDFFNKQAPYRPRYFPGQMSEQTDIQWSCHGLPTALLVGDMFCPGPAAARLVSLEHRQVGYDAVGGSTVPVVLTWREENAASRTATSIGPPRR